MKLKPVIAALGLTGVAGLAAAAGTAEFRALDDAGKRAAMQFAWRDANTAKMTLQDPSAQGAQMLILEQGTYMVVRGQVMAMDGFAAKGQPSIGGESELIALTGPHGSHQVAGYRGQLYRMRWRDRSGEQQSEAVLSTDPLVREMTEAWMGATARLAGNPAGQHNGFGGELKKRGLGILAVDGSFEITRLDASAPPAAAFALPAGAARSAPAGAASGGFNFRDLIPGAAEDKAERQAERQSDNINKRVDRETDSAMDKAMDGMLDKLFGN